MAKDEIVEQQYQAYLKLVELKEENFGDVQRTEMRRTFFGAYGMAVDKIIDILTDITKDEKQRAETISSISLEIGMFWAKENLQNPEKPKDDDSGFKIIH